MTTQKLKNINEKKCRIGILTSPTEKASVTPISNLIDILKVFSSNIVIITGNAAYGFFKNDKTICSYNLSYPIEKNYTKKILNYFWAQLKGSYILLKQRDQVDAWIFFIGGERQLIPILITKLLRKPSLLVLTGSSVQSAIHSHDPFLLPIRVLFKINCHLTTGILIYSPRLIHEAKLENYKKKIFVAKRHFVDLDLFRQLINYSDRPDMVGYVGRLSEEKGVINLVKSFSGIISKNPNMHFFIAGDGELLSQLVDIISSDGLKEKVYFAGWIPHDELSIYLNQLRLLVLPSYTEGLPNIMLEAMACGTPVLATPVGAIQDMIQDEETGFILEDNSPQKIEESVIHALNHPHLKTIANNGKIFIDSKFSFQKAVDSYALILSNFSNLKLKTEEKIEER